MLLRNKDAPALCQVTKLAVKKEKPHFVEAKILNGYAKGTISNCEECIT
jgi:hypothetical protein